jgi:ABC-type dipeptide/oligopeptide/nickel transport system permease component
MEGIFNGDVDCFYSCGSVRSAFVDALPVTISLVAGAGLIAIALGISLALVCVRHRADGRTGPS